MQNFTQWCPYGKKQPQTSGILNYA